jgi:hypothetical protein
MNISDFYKYSWFADLAYVEWNDSNRISNEAVKSAQDAKRAPLKLAEKIFLAYIGGHNTYLKNLSIH